MWSGVFGHRVMKISHPVRSAVNKHRIDRLVLQWVTMWESRLLNSFFGRCFAPVWSAVVLDRGGGVKALAGRGMDELSHGLSLHSSELYCIIVSC